MQVQNEKKAGKFLGRVIKWTENGLTYKGDDKLLESLLEEWNVHGMTAVQTPGERINSETDKRADVSKTSEKLCSFTVNEESVRKLRCEFEGGPSWKDVCYRSIIDRDTGDVLERERYVRGMPLRVAESTLVRPRNITTTLHFRLRGPEQLRSGDWDERRVARYRRAAAKLNYLALDNPCIAYASKEVSRKMSDPEPSDEKSIIRVLRYLKQSGMVEYLYKWQDSPTEILVYTDSDWAGCQRTRRSTTGGAVMYGSCLVAHWSRTQVSVALSQCQSRTECCRESSVRGYWNEAAVWAFEHASQRKDVLWFLSDERDFVSQRVWQGENTWRHDSSGFRST